MCTKQMEFLDTVVYKNEQHKIQASTFYNPTDQQMNNQIIPNLLKTVFHTAKRYT